MTMVPSPSDPVSFTFPETAQEVRSLIIDGEPWWIANDVCAILEIANARQSLSYLEGDEKGVTTADTLGGPQQVTIVNEPGLYSLIIRSRKPQAKAFKRWITHDVIPAIRRTGNYSIDRRLVSPLDLAEQMLVSLRDQDRRTTALEAKVAAIEGEHDWFTALGYAKLHGHSTSRPFLARVGRRAAAILREQGGVPHQRQDATFGKVNTYPVAALQRAFAETE